MSFFQGIDANFDFPMMSYAQGRKHFSVMNMAKAKKIYEYYYSLERYVEICRNIKYALVFKGGISLTWGGIFYSNNADQDELIDLLKKALDYRNMFGMCPIKVIKDKETGEKRAVIPDFGTGIFARSFNETTSQIEVHFLYNKIASGTEHWESVMSYKTTPDPNTFVYVWPEKKPSFLNKNFVSPVFFLYKEYKIINAFINNAIDSDYDASHPTIFTQSRKDTKNLSQLTEDEVFGEIDASIMTPGEKHTYRRDVFRSIRMEKMMKSINSDIKNGRKVEDAPKDDLFLPRKRFWQENMEPLAEGEEIARQISIKSRDDLLEWRSTYEDSVCLMMGVPRNYVLSKSKFKSDTEQERNLLRNSVDSDRDDAKKFYRFVYDFMQRKTDNKRLIRGLTSLNEQKKEGKSLDRIKYLKDHIKRIGRMKDRIELHFNQDPFAMSIDINTILLASDREAITSLEEINIIRQKLGLEEIKQEDPLVKLREEDRKIKRQMKKEQPEKTRQQPEKKKQKIT